MSMAPLVLDWTEIALRLGGATVIGGAIGLNRDLHHKSAGLRTLGLVALVSAAVTMGTAQYAGAESATRVIQGLLTGVGFLGAGVIVHGPSGKKVQGLTTAAAIWGSTAVGALCAMGEWPLITITIALMFALLVFGGRVEKRLHGALADDDKPGREP